MQGAIKDKIYHKYEKEKSKLRKVKGGAWTVNLDYVDPDEVDTIIYETKKFIYKIDAFMATQVGNVETLGGELKLIVPLCFWTKIKK